MPIWYYMRDNHTFRRIESFDEKELRYVMMEEFLQGWTYGMLCSKGSEKVIHARGQENFESFIQDCLEVVK